VHASHEALTLHSPVAHRRLPWLTLLSRCECLKRHGVGRREGELGADFTSLVLPSRAPEIGRPFLMLARCTQSTRPNSITYQTTRSSRFGPRNRNYFIFGDPWTSHAVSGPVLLTCPISAPCYSRLKLPLGAIRRLKCQLLDGGCAR
jgi:hypothetical protein